MRATRRCRGAVACVSVSAYRCVPFLSRFLPSRPLSAAAASSLPTFLLPYSLSLCARATSMYSLNVASGGSRCERWTQVDCVEFAWQAVTQAGGQTGRQTGQLTGWRLEARAAGVRATSMRFSLAHAHARIRTCIATERRTKEGGTRGECRDARPKNIHPFLRPRNRGKS